MTQMTRRPATAEESVDLREAVREMAWQHARRLSDLASGEPPASPFDGSSLDEAGQRAAVLALLGALHDISRTSAELTDMLIALAGDAGATGPAIGRALGGISGSAVRKRWPNVVNPRPGPNPARRVPSIDPSTSIDWDRPADRDWAVRARIRLRQGLVEPIDGGLRREPVGSELMVVMRGRAGKVPNLHGWFTEDTPDRPHDELLVDVGVAQVLEVFEEVSPWVDQHVELVTEGMREPGQL